MRGASTVRRLSSNPYCSVRALHGCPAVVPNASSAMPMKVVGHGEVDCAERRAFYGCFAERFGNVAAAGQIVVVAVVVAFPGCRRDALPPLLSACAVSVSSCLTEKTCERPHC